jgi:hypothetical protein
VESNLIVSITITGDAMCRASDKTYRLDIEAARHGARLVSWRRRRPHADQVVQWHHLPPARVRCRGPCHPQQLLPGLLVLEDCFDGLITLTQVDSRQDADIVLHHVAHAGGAIFSGYAICGDPRLPQHPRQLGGAAQLGPGALFPRAAGLDHDARTRPRLGPRAATSLLESTDLMGYGWPDLGDPVLSQCDIEVLAFVFAWALEGVEPYPPGEGPYEC